MATNPPPSASFPAPIEGSAEEKITTAKPTSVPPEAGRESATTRTTSTKTTTTEPAAQTIPKKKFTTVLFRLEVCCFLAGVCFCIGNILQYIRRSTMSRGNTFHNNSYRTMEGEGLIRAWEDRQGSAHWEIIAGFITCTAWLFFSIPICQLAFVMSNHGKRRLWLHTMMATLAFGGSMAKFVSRLMHVGLWMSCNWMAVAFGLNFWDPKDGSTLDNHLGWKTLEVVYRVGQGATNWVNSFEYLCLFGVFVLFAMSVSTLPEEVYCSFGGRGLSFLGLLIALGSVFNFIITDFGLEGLQIDKRFLHQVSLLLAVVSSGGFLPLWLFVMGCRLPRAVQVTEEYQIAEERAKEGLDVHLPESEEEAAAAGAE